MKTMTKNLTERPTRCIDWRDAVTMLESGEPCNLRLWKMSTGDILEYKGAVCIGHHWRHGTHRVKLPASHLIREFRDVTLFEINGYEIIR